MSLHLPLTSHSDQPTISQLSLPPSQSYSLQDLGSPLHTSPSSSTFDSLSTSIEPYSVFGCKLLTLAAILAVSRSIGTSLKLSSLLPLLLYPSLLPLLSLPLPSHVPVSLFDNPLTTSSTLLGYYEFSSSSLLLSYAVNILSLLTPVGYFR